VVKFNKLLFCSFSIAMASGGQSAFGTTTHQQVSAGVRTATYEVHGYRFDVGTPVNVRTQTTHFTGEAYNHADSVLTTTIVGLSLQLDSSPIGSGNNYAHTVGIAEIDTGENFYDAAAIGFNNNLQSCASYNTLDFDSSTGHLTGISIGSSSIITNTCDNQTISTGLIIMNTNRWPSLFGGTPPQDAQEHWLIHEFTHLLGVGHITDFSQSGECISMMTRTISELPCNTMPTPTDYIDTDLELLRQLGYR